MPHLCECRLHETGRDLFKPASGHLAGESRASRLASKAFENAARDVNTQVVVLVCVGWDARVHVEDSGKEGGMVTTARLQEERNLLQACAMIILSWAGCNAGLSPRIAR